MTKSSQVLAAPTGLADRLKAHVYQLSHEIGERNVYDYDGLMQAQQYVSDQLASHGYAVRFQEYEVQADGARRMVRNIVAEKAGSHAPGEVVILGAHYDNCHTSQGNPGADDNASAVAGMLEVARMLKDAPIKRTMRYVAFVNEEPPFFQTPLMGSAVYARDARSRGDNIYLAVIFEMIGFFSDEPGSQNYRELGPMAGLLALKYPTAANFITAMGDQQSLDRLREVSALYEAQKPAVPMETNLELPALGEMLAKMCLSDNLSFWAEGLPAIMVGDTAFVRNHNYHQQTDTYDTLDYGKMSEVVHAMGGVLSQL